MLNKKVMIVSLGCDKNLVDTEKMLGILADEGCTFTDDEAQAQVIIVNTCCFIGDAKEESIQNILDLARFKTEGKLEALIATGCLSQRYQDEMLEAIAYCHLHDVKLYMTVNRVLFKDCRRMQ